MLTSADACARGEFALNSFPLWFPAGRYTDHYEMIPWAQMAGETLSAGADPVAADDRGEWHEQTSILGSDRVEDWFESLVTIIRVLPLFERVGVVRGAGGARCILVAPHHKTMFARREGIPRELDHQILCHERLPHPADELAARMPARPPIYYNVPIAAFIAHWRAAVIKQCIR